MPFNGSPRGLEQPCTHRRSPLESVSHIFTRGQGGREYRAPLFILFFKAQFNRGLLLFLLNGQRNGVVFYRLNYSCHFIVTYVYEQGRRISFYVQVGCLDRLWRLVLVFVSGCGGLRRDTLVCLLFLHSGSGIITLLYPKRAMWSPNGSHDLLESSGDSFILPPKGSILPTLERGDMSPRGVDLSFSSV